MTIADQAIANALQIEAKKHALRQQQDGCWILTMKVHQNDMPLEIMKAPMGARYVVALVEVGDDEQPVNRKKENDNAAEVTHATPRQQPDLAVGADGYPIWPIPADMNTLPQRAPEAVETAPRPAPTGNAPVGDESLMGGQESTRDSDNTSGRAWATRPTDKPKSPAQVAGYLCTLPMFMVFLREAYEEDWEACRQLGGLPGQTAREVVCLRCGVKSRSDITADNTAWRAILSDYRAWEKAAEVIG